LIGAAVALDADNAIAAVIAINKLSRFRLMLLLLLVSVSAVRSIKSVALKVSSKFSLEQTVCPVLMDEAVDDNGSDDSYGI
jgi:hypothetical protein